jgi:hydrophobe/amphiphile efflux-3 (HAE3) family protein
VTARRLLERLAGGAAARPLPVLVACAALALIGAALAAGLHPSTGTDTLVGAGSGAGRATTELHERFGDDAVVVLIRERLPDLVDTADLGRLIKLEGCLGGKVPRGAKPYGPRGGPCYGLAERRPARAVYGPGTFLFEAVNAVQDALLSRLSQGRDTVRRAGEAARGLARGRGLSRARQETLAREAERIAQVKLQTDLARIALRAGLSGIPRIDDKGFINSIVFDATRGASTPKARFAYLFPSADAALVSVRLRPGLSDAERERAIGLIRRAVALPEFKLRRGGTYTVTGVPVLASGLAGRIGHAIGVLLVGALFVMALTLLVAFRARPRLLPLAVALAAAGVTFGAVRLAGAGLTMASIAVLPVLIGLAVDYAIQFQSRVAEAGDVGRGAAAGAPTIATAGLATAVGFLVLLLSPVPMVRGFGLVLVLGVLVALALTFTGDAAALAVLRDRPPGAPARGLGAAARGAGEIVSGLPGIPRARRAGAARGRAALALAIRRPERVLAVGLALAALGWAAEARTDVVSDVTRLVPQDLGALRDIEALQAATGVAGELDVLVQARDVTDPEVVAWMTSFQRRALARAGYRTDRACGRARLCPALSLPDLFSTGPKLTTGAQVRKLLATVPPYFSQAVVSPDRRAANIAFGIRLMPLSEQQELIEDLRGRLDPPAGVQARLAGLPVLAAEANDRLASPWRRLGLLAAGLLAVGLALWAAFRDRRRALVPLVPIALATGWASLAVAPIALNPMSATLGALVVAISTEFSVLLSERYRQERVAGHGVEAALHRAYRSTGAAVVASGLTAIAGFAVLALSEIAMLRNFGLVTVLDLSIALVGVLLVLPAVLVLHERGALLALPRRALGGLPSRPRRAAPDA